MSSKMQFQVFYGDYNVMYGQNGVDLSAFKCTSSAIDKPLERSFGSICNWLQRGFRVDPLTHVTRCPKQRTTAINTEIATWNCDNASIVARCPKQVVH